MNSLVPSQCWATIAAAAAAKSLQSSPTLCDPIDGSPPVSPVPETLQPRTLEWVAIYSSNARKWKVKLKSLSRVRLLATPWTAAYQAPPSMGFSRQEHWSGNHYLCPIPKHFHNSQRKPHIHPPSSQSLAPTDMLSICIDSLFRAFHRNGTTYDFCDWFLSFF